MTLTEAATETTASSRLMLRCGAAAGVVFVASSLIQALTRHGFDFTRNAFSQLSLGGPGWIQVTTFLLTGALAIAGAFGMRSALVPGRGARWAPILVGVFGLSFVVSGLFKADPGEGFPTGAPDAMTVTTEGVVHLTSASVGFIALCVALGVLASRFRQDGESGWAAVCVVILVVVLGGSSASSTSVLAFTIGGSTGLLGLTAVLLHLSSRAAGGSAAR
ncbi:DUF998 domain-containing protein [Mumia zhuanghuii]|uniref:DUF998 domain-containing protein n=2 Tax=Mumia TaxID=1546255 RepID=A0ABW1QGL4_9ACTN|nr:MULTISPECIES: DUF998 domain-containing protein [Mumia]KAA1424779.1 DUF998 domain-containing protein [Mumia zhuanghuii]